MQINLTLSLKEVNTILAGLMQGPYNEVANLISEIEAQAKPQLEKFEPAEVE